MSTDKMIQKTWAHRARAQRTTTDVHRNPHTVKKTSSCLVILNFISVFWAVETDTKSTQAQF